MVRLSGEKKKEILTLLREGKSLSSISTITKTSKQTIYYYYKKIALKHIPKVRCVLENKELLGEFIGICAGDGYANKDNWYHYQVRLFFNKRDRAYINHVEKLLFSLFNKSPFRIPREEYNVVVLKYNSKEIYNLVKKYLSWESSGKGSKSRTVKVLNIPTTKKFHYGFLRGCLDTDGHISKTRIEFATTSPHLAQTIMDLLTISDFQYRHTAQHDKRKNRAPVHTIRIPATVRKRFIRVIKPKNAPGGIFGS